MLNKLKNIHFVIASLFCIFLCILPADIALANSDCSTTVKHPMIESSKDRLIFKLLQLSLSKVSPNVCYEQLDKVITEARKSMFIKKGLIDLQWASADSFADDLLIPVTIPIFKGLLGYRIFVIKKGDQHRFDQIKNLSDLQKLVAGQGAFWGDTKVLRNAGLPVMTSTKGRRLWQMLNVGRFDYLPLAVHEPWRDIELRPDYNLTVEKNLMLVYPMALFFYVNKQNELLHQLLEKGMKIAIQDGSYDQVLKSSDMIQSAEKYAHMESRRIIYIENPEINSVKQMANYKEQTAELIRLITEHKL